MEGGRGGASEGGSGKFLDRGSSSMIKSNDRKGKIHCQPDSYPYVQNVGGIHKSTYDIIYLAHILQIQYKSTIGL